MFIDILILSIDFINFELSWKKTPYLFSAYTMFIFAFNFIFLLPYYMTKLPIIGEFVRVGRLSFDELNDFFWFVRLFFYSWLFLAIYFIYRSKFTREFVQVDVTNANAATLRILFLFVILVNIIFLGVGTDFSISEMVRRAFFPREYTDIKMGVGPLLFLKHTICGILLVCAAYNAIKKRSFRSYLILIVALLLNFVGGTKTSFVINFFVLFMVYQKIKLNKIKREPFKNMFKLMLLAPMLLAITISSFYLMSDRNNQIDQIKRIGRYQAESYYTALVLHDYNWKAEYLISGIKDTIAAYIPRAIYPDKPTVGFYRNYWKERYEPNAPPHHTSTFGVLAEAFMMFGYAGSFLYGVIFAFLCRLSNGLYLKSSNIGSVFFSIYTIYWLYFLMRAGLTGFALAQPVVVFIFTYLIWNKRFKI